MVNVILLQLFIIRLHQYEPGLVSKIKDHIYYKFQSNDSLRRAIRLYSLNRKLCLQTYGELDFWNTINITDMSYLFEFKNFIGEGIKYWNTQNVSNMEGLFYDSLFEGDISSWNVSKVTNMKNMFCFAIYFNYDISGWNIKSLENVECMFRGTRYFNQDLSHWKLKSNIRGLNTMFLGSKISSLFKPQSVI